MQDCIDLEEKIFKQLPLQRHILSQTSIDHSLWLSNHLWLSSHRIIFNAYIYCQVHDDERKQDP
jgi:hypothetical protein